MHTRSESSSQQLTPVNCSNLDELVLEYLADEGLIEDVEPDSSEDLPALRLAAYAAHQQLYLGCVESAVAIVRQYCPEVLEDQRLTFKLKRQQFIELLRKATTVGDAAALACAREELAPLALDAYPEAYLDFKKALLMLVQQQQVQQQEQARPPQEQQAQQAMLQQGQQSKLQDWSLEARHRLAEILHHTILQHIGHTGPRLTQQLVYLLHIFNLYSTGAHGSSRGSSSSSTAQIQQLVSNPEAKLVNGLLLEGRDDGPLQVDGSGVRPAERDVQALMSALSIPRSSAQDALKAAHGDVALALKHELLRSRVNRAQLDLLVWEYAVARNLLEPSDSPAAVNCSEMDLDAPLTAAAAASPDASKASKRSKAARCADRPHSTSSPFQAAAAAAAAGPLAAAAAAGGGGGGQAELAAVRTAAAAAAGVDGALLRRESQSPPYKVPRWRSKQNPSRFCGSRPLSLAVPAAELDQQQQQQEEGGCSSVRPDLRSDQPQQTVQGLGEIQQQQRWQQLQQQLKNQAVASDVFLRQTEAQQSLQKIQILVDQARYPEVEELLEDLQPGLLQDYPVVGFDMKRLQFIQLIRRNDLPAALQLARTQLTPLADKHPELLPSLKSAMALLLPGQPGSSSSTGSSSDADLADRSGFLSMLLPLLQSKLGIEPPRLVKLFRVLLTAHKRWFRVQRCNDPFLNSLGLDRLLQPEDPSAAAAGVTGQQQQEGELEGGLSGISGRAASRLHSAAAAAFAAAARQALLEDPLDLNGGVDMHDEMEVEGPEFDEASVLQIMEVLELPRAAALELLAEHDGDAQAAIMQVFG